MLLVQLLPQTHPSPNQTTRMRLVRSRRMRRLEHFHHYHHHRFHHHHHHRLLRLCLHQRRKPKAKCVSRTHRRPHLYQTMLLLPPLSSFMSYAPYSRPTRKVVEVPIAMSCCHPCPSSRESTDDKKQQGLLPVPCPADGVAAVVVMVGSRYFCCDGPKYYRAVAKA